MNHFIRNSRTYSHTLDSRWEKTKSYIFDFFHVCVSELVFSARKLIGHCEYVGDVHISFVVIFFLLSSILKSAIATICMQNTNAYLFLTKIRCIHWNFSFVQKRIVTYSQSQIVELMTKSFRNSICQAIIIPKSWSVDLFKKEWKTRCIDQSDIVFKSCAPFMLPYKVNWMSFTPHFHSLSVILLTVAASGSLSLKFIQRIRNAFHIWSIKRNELTNSKINHAI